MSIQENPRTTLTTFKVVGSSSRPTSSPYHAPDGHMYSGNTNDSQEVSTPNMSSEAYSPVVMEMTFPSHRINSTPLTSYVASYASQADGFLQGNSQSHTYGIGSSGIQFHPSSHFTRLPITQAPQIGQSQMQAQNKRRKIGDQPSQPGKGVQPLSQQDGRGSSAKRATYVSCYLTTSKFTIETR